MRLFVSNDSISELVINRSLVDKRRTFGETEMIEFNFSYKINERKKKEEKQMGN